ncbi:MAG: MerR family transcriptional regulator [Spirochaetales bacterium]|jgi:DNA-binding transcriptional MerR regulator|nr:MerR family transcriptional regulator [Spirochaetales bacterium]
MRRLGIGEVCRLLDIKPHVLRYWEEEISFLEPEKNVGGRRMYGDTEMNLLYRLKYLIVEKRLTVEGAKLALLDEMSGPSGNEKAEILAQRRNLLDSLAGLDRLKEKTSDLIGSSFIPPDQEYLREIWKDLPVRKRRNLSFDLIRLPRNLFTLLGAIHAGSPPDAAFPGLELVPRGSVRGGFEEARQRIAEGRLALVTIVPEMRSEISGVPGKDAPAVSDKIATALVRLARAIKEGSREYGKMPLWYIFTPPGKFSPDYDPVQEKKAPQSFRGLLSREDSLFFDEENIVFSRQPFFPYLDSQGRPLLEKDGHIAGYASGMAGVFLVISSPAFQRGLASRGIDTLNMLPINRFSLNFPDRELLAGHCQRGAGLSVLCLAAGSGNGEGPACRTSGNYILSRDFLSSCNPAFYRAPAVIAAPDSADELEQRPAGIIRTSFISCITRAASAWGIREEG